jgi:hypothetical protein
MIIFLVRVSPVNVKFTADIALERRLVANLVMGVLNIVFLLIEAVTSLARSEHNHFLPVAMSLI